MRLIALYALRYEKHQNNSLPALRDLLVHCGVNPLKVSVFYRHDIIDIGN